MARFLSGDRLQAKYIRSYIMKKRRILLSVIILLISRLLFSAEPGVLSLKVIPVITIPVRTSTDRYSTGGGGKLQGEYVLPFLPFSHIFAGLEYNYIPVLNIGEPLSILACGGGAGVHFSLNPGLTIKVSGETGYFIGIFRSHPLLI
jgi:hypothetical protein